MKKEVDLSYVANDPYRISAKNPPKLRGKLHLAMILPSIALGIWLVTLAPTTAYKFLTGIYVFTIAFMFTVSSIFHIFQWTDKQWWKLRKLDHTGIYLLIAGTYLAYGAMALQGEVRVLMLVISGALILFNITYRWLPLIPLRGTMIFMFIAVGWVAIVFAKWLWEGLGVAGFSFLVGGGIVFTLGAVVLGTRKPNPSPAIFGYHEVWHIATILGIGLQVVGLIVGVF